MAEEQDNNKVVENTTLDETPDTTKECLSSSRFIDFTTFD